MIIPTASKRAPPSPLIFQTFRSVTVWRRLTFSIKDRQGEAMKAGEIKKARRKEVKKLSRRMKREEEKCEDFVGLNDIYCISVGVTVDPPS